MKLKNKLGLVIARSINVPMAKVEPPVIRYGYWMFTNVVKVAGHVITTLRSGPTSGSGMVLRNKHALYRNGVYMGDIGDDEGAHLEYLYQKLQGNGLSGMSSCHDTLTSQCRARGFYRETGKRLYGSVGSVGHQANDTLMTGNPLLNKTLRDGFRRGELPVIAAPTTAGRSQLRVSIASYMDELRLRKAMFTLASKYEYTAEGMFPTSRKYYYT